MFYCKTCNQPFENVMTLARHVRDNHPKKPIIDQQLPPDRSQLEKTSSSLLNDLREEYLTRRYINLINDMENPRQQQPQQLTETSKFKDLLELFKVLKEGKSDLTLNDALTQIRTLRELESEIEPREPESMETQLLQEGIKAFMVSKQQPITPIIPQPQPQPQQVVYTDPAESSLSDVVSELLTDKAKTMIKITPKELAYSKVKDFINLTKDEFSEVYEKIKKE